ncbi:spore germination protein GerPC [Virgibacillus doumboii]|uniref:spore germination protein GerPC n=1 Tax=Virgibacillus doumboii TaxID=2697503 RepID=UPI0013DF3306|nr:spore germination protein GerPC [Virgibacillus doumboii]
MNGWNNYFYNLYQRIDEQDRTIRDLESRLQQLENMNNQQNQKPVEKIEYHFDQLKIENLEGTLHIGLSPGDLKNIDDFSVPDAGQSPFKQQLLSDLNAYLRQHGEKLIHDTAVRHQVSMENIDPAILIEDMAKQLPERIAYYEAEAKKNKQDVSDKQVTLQISDTIKREIDHSLNKYMEGNDPANDYGSP